MFVLTSTPLPRRRGWALRWACPSVRLPAYLKNHPSKLCQIFAACCLWPSPGPPRAALRYVVHFRLCERYHVCPAICSRASDKRDSSVGNTGVRAESAVYSCVIWLLQWVCACACGCVYSIGTRRCTTPPSTGNCRRQRTSSSKLTASSTPSTTYELISLGRIAAWLAAWRSG